jgi:glutaredoxin-related protein
MVGLSQVYIKGQPVGGCSDLKKLQAEGKLTTLLA